jgi:hypothetical protein
MIDQYRTIGQVVEKAVIHQSPYVRVVPQAKA